MNRVLTSRITVDNATSDLSLIRIAKTGDRTGYAMLFIRYQERLYNSIMQMVGSAAIADDIVQDAFLRAFQKLDTFRGDSQFYSWLFRIAINLRRGYFHTSRREALMTDLGSLVDQPAQDRSPSSQLVIKEARERVRKALTRIEPHHRKILVLREFDRLSYEAIGSQMGVGLGTVRSRLSRARARIRRELE